jgi:putative addiction module component (TIGR02574 family)
MGPKAQKLLEAALELPEDERADVVGALVESLGPTDPDHEGAWSEEIKRRIQEVESGKVKTIPWEQVDRGIRELLDSRRRRRA